MHLDQNVVMSIREATPTDVPEILAMIHELAAYETARIPQSSP
jgi:N-acetylglutamate synthase-like GNAT family acetyltransferase